MVLAASDGFFGALNDFFGSGGWPILRNLSIFLVVVFWLAIGYWVYKDARRRIEDPWLVAMATVLGLVPPFVGPIVYLFFRPPEYIEDVRERELEIRAMEDRLSKRDLHKCNAPLEALWQICPHCATPVVTPALPGIDDTIADSWTAPRKRAAGDE